MALFEPLLVKFVDTCELMAHQVEHEISLCSFFGIQAIQEKNNFSCHTHRLISRAKVAPHATLRLSVGIFP